MKTLLLMGLLLMSGTLFAQQPIEIKVWPNGAPNDNGITEEKNGDTDSPSYTKETILYVYPAKKGNGMAIVACPGGGYSHLAMAHEGKSMADWFNSQGITYAVLRYRMPNGHNEVPAERFTAGSAHHAPARSGMECKKTGHHGFFSREDISASTTATHFTDAETRPDFQILFYPVITMDPAYTRMGSHDNLLGKNPSKELEQKYSNELQVTPQTPPAFILHSSDDTAVPVANSVNYYTALVKNKVPASLHTYPVGGHGWGYRDSFPYKRQWTGELEKWLREINK